MILRRFHYYRRILAAYGLRKPSQLTFWHEKPELNEHVSPDKLGEYYMVFGDKADYPGPFDDHHVPLLNYHGIIGLQYNPIAIAQYGLANYNQYIRTGDPQRKFNFLHVADWLVENLEENSAGFSVWQHHFDWDYRTTLRAPWYSGLAQGQGISLLVRACSETGETRYADAARSAFEPFLHSVEDGGIIFFDSTGDCWIEEYVVSPPTHILNGFIWASWGLYDYFLLSGDIVAKTRFAEVTQTLEKNLSRYDVGFWSLYELSGTWLHMVASPFYHSLHVVQLEAMYRLTSRPMFREYSRKWDRYRQDRWRRMYALSYKAIFKLCYY